MHLGVRGSGRAAHVPSFLLGVCEGPVRHRWGVIGVRLWGFAGTKCPRWDSSVPPPAGTAAVPKPGRVLARRGVINELMQPRYCVISSTQSTPCASSCCYRSLNVAPGGTFGTGTGLGCWGCPGGGCSLVTDPAAGCICWGKASDPPPSAANPPHKSCWRCLGAISVQPLPSTNGVTPKPCLPPPSCMGTPNPPLGPCNLLGEPTRGFFLYTFIFPELSSP